MIFFKNYNVATDENYQIIERKWKLVSSRRQKNKYFFESQSRLILIINVIHQRMINRKRSFLVSSYFNSASIRSSNFSNYSCRVSQTTSTKVCNFGLMILSQRAWNDEGASLAICQLTCELRKREQLLRIICHRIFNASIFQISKRHALIRIAFD